MEKYDTVVINPKRSDASVWSMEGGLTLADWKKVLANAGVNVRKIAPWNMPNEDSNHSI